MFGSNEIRSDERSIVESISYYLVIITSFCSRVNIESHCRRERIKAQTIFTRSRRLIDIYILIVSHSLYSSLLCSLFHSHRSFSHVISLLTRIYFLYRSVLQFAICFQYEHTIQCLYVSKDASFFLAHTHTHPSRV